MHAVVAGMIATYPLGGVAWDYGQYLTGLEKLGFDVFYLEDTGAQTYDPERGDYGDDPSYAVEFLREAMEQLSPKLRGRWHFRAADGRCYGLAADTMRELIADADVFVNVSGSAILRDEYLASRRKVLIDTDPGWNHFVNYPRADAGERTPGVASYREHDYFFTYAERIGRPGCRLPHLGLEWRPTRVPIDLAAWDAAGPRDSWTTVMTWNNFHRPIVNGDETYGTKEMEFAKVERLPSMVCSPLEIAVSGHNAPVASWVANGWRVVRAEDISRSAGAYREYIQSSRGEFSVAKNIYVGTLSGWSSCRSACYLAAGRPVVVQDTGFSEVIACGEGLLAFDTLDGACEAIERVERDYAMNSAAARDVAEREFASDKVLGDLLWTAGVG